MRQKMFGALVASALTGLIAGNAAAADAKAKDAKKAAPKAGKCVHNCSGYAECKGNGSDSCKGKNGCANEGLVPKACSDVKSAEACKEVLDAKKNKMCTWYES